MTKYPVDLSGINSRDGLHERLAQVFSFPNYYGRNWDAFGECIADLAPPVSIVVTGYESLRSALPREANECQVRGREDSLAVWLCVRLLTAQQLALVPSDWWSGS
jgi:RNAse (barnase) inhibitor barstar